MEKIVMEVSGLKCGCCGKTKALIDPSMDFIHIDVFKVPPIENEKCEVLMETESSFHLCPECYAALERLYSDLKTVKKW